MRADAAQEHRPGPEIDGETAVRLSLIPLSQAAALIHATVLGQHFTEWWVYRVMFAAPALFQGLWGTALIFKRSHAALAFGALVNAGVIAVWGNVTYCGPSIRTGCRQR